MDTYKAWIEKNMLKGNRPFIWIICIGLLVWLQVLFFNFVFLDDNALILDNISFLKDFSNIPKTFSQDIFNFSYTFDAYYRPIVLSSFIFDAHIGGDAPFIYHLSNVLIHLINACLVFILFSKLGYKRIISLIISLIFVIHPVVTEAVAWVAGRNDSLLALFSLSSVIMFLTYFETKKPLYIALHLLFFTLALFTKESALGIIIIAILIYIFFQKKIDIPLKMKCISLVGWIVISMLWFIMRNNAFTNPFPVTFPEGIRLIFENIVPISLLQLGKIILPFNLSVLETTQDSTLLWGILSVLLITVVFIFIRIKNYKMIILGVVWFLIFTTPTLLITNFLVLENRVYLPMIGILIVCGEILSTKKEIFINGKNMVYGLVLLLVLTSITLSYSTKFDNRIVFWESAVKDSPYLPLAHRNLGAMYYLDNRLPEAEREYLKTLELNPNVIMVHNNLGLIYMHQAQYKKAEQAFKTEINLYPTYDTAYYNLGILYYSQKKYQKAEKMWKKTIEVNPNYLQAYSWLVKLYDEQGRGDDAMEYRKILEHFGFHL